MTVQTSIEAGPLYSTLDSDPDLGEMVDLFLEEMPERVANFLNLLGHQDRQELGRAAHQLKGAAGSYGFKQISPCAARLEDAVEDGLPIEQIRQLVEELTGLCRRAAPRPADGDLP